MEFTFALNGQVLKSPDKYVVDRYGNRYMIFSDAAGNKFKIIRDELLIDMATGICKQRNKQINMVKV